MEKDDLGNPMFMYKLPKERLSLEQYERQLLLLALEEANWVQKEAAELLDISSRVLHYKIHHTHAIQWSALRDQAIRLAAEAARQQQVSEETSAEPPVESSSEPEVAPETVVEGSPELVEKP